MGIAYCSREDVTAALSYNESARANSAVDRACQSAARSVEGLLHRVFYPLAETRTFTNVSRDRLQRDRFWLDADEMISVSSVTGAGTLVTARRLPASGGPITSLYFDNGLSLGLEDSLDVAGVFGYADDSVVAGTLAAAIVSTSATTLTVSDGSLVGVGDVIRIDNERLQVTGRDWVTSGQTGSLTASNADTQLTVATGSAFHAGEAILLDGETMRVDAIAGNVLTVKRAVAGVLAAHSTATVYTSRLLTVVRASLGTTAATHLISAPVTKWQAPGLVYTLAIAEACNTLLQESGGWASATGPASAAGVPAGGDLGALRRQAYATYGRKARMRSV